MAAMNQSDKHWDADDAAEMSELQQLLHEAIDRLTKKDRLCVVMSFLQERTPLQVAAAMGVSLDAARKRISRAVERLREYVASRGTIVPAAEIAAALGVKHAALSAAFVQSTLNIAVLSHSTDAVGMASTIAKGVNKMIFATKLKIAAALAVALMLTGIVTAQAVKILGESAIGPIAAQVQTPAAPASDVVVDKSSVDLGGGVLVEFVGVSRYKQNDWHDINGQPINPPSTTSSNVTFGQGYHPAYSALLHVTCPDDTDVEITLPNGKQRGMGGKGIDRVIDFDVDVDGAATSVDISIQVADGPWKTIMTAQADMYISQDSGTRTTPGVEANFSPLSDEKGKALVYASMAGINSPMRIACIGMDRKEYIGQGQGGVYTTHAGLSGFLFDIPRKQVKTLEVQTRAYTKHVTAKNICLDPSNPTTAQIVVDPK